MKRIILVITTAILAVAGHKAAAQERVVAAEAHIDYRVDKSNYEPSYMGNAQALVNLRHAVDSIGPANIDSVLVYCYASPEGGLGRNLTLASLRTSMTLAVLNREFPDLQGKLFGEARGESWSALREYVGQDTKLSANAKQRIYDVIDATGISQETRKWRMQNRLGSDPAVGDVYSYIFKKYYKIIRNATILVFKPKGSNLSKVCLINDDELVFVDEVNLPEEPIELPALATNIAFKGKENIFALKTNLLYDAATMLNFEVEVPFAKRWSVMVEDIFPWWEFSKNKYALQNWEIGAELRYWFKEWQAYDRKLEGWFLGAYAMSAKYDIQWDKTFCWQGYYWSPGITAGYCMPLGRNHWGRLEFSLSAGYLNGSYQHYWPDEEYTMLIKDKYNSGRFMYIGPTKAKVSLVIPISFNTKRSRTMTVIE